MVVDWICSDDTNTLAHVAEIELDNKKALFPQHALTHSDYNIFSEVDREDKISKKNTIVVGEPLNQHTLEGVGHKAEVTDALYNRLRGKMVSGKINFVHPRIPNMVKQGDTVTTITKIDDLQASALVGIQLDLNASAIIPPIPNII